MSKVLAAIDNSAAAGPVLAVAAAVSRLLHADLQALHVREDGARVARAAAAAAGVGLQETVIGPPPESMIGALLQAAEASDVEAMVVGARATPVGRRPVGHVALALTVSLRKPLIVVPPHAVVADPLRCILVPLDGTPTTAAALTRTIEFACDAAVEVVALHVHESHTLPFFSEQAQHELESWKHEFLARNIPGREHDLRLEVRVGVPGEHVMRVAAETNPDLIALGWAQDLDEGRAAVVRDMLERSNVPLLLVPISTHSTTTHPGESGA